MRLLVISILLVFGGSIKTISAQEVTQGFASSYPLAYEGTRTASGEVYNSKEYTARHASLPFNTLVKVTNLKNNKSVTVRINDRFNYKNSRVIDVSKAAARAINLFGDINPQVKIEVIGVADALMLAATPKANTSNNSQLASTSSSKEEKAKEKSTAVAKAEIKPKKKDGKIVTPDLLPSVKATLPSISLKDVSNIAAVTLEYITISLFE